MRSNWRVLTAVLAVILAVLAGVLVWKYVDDQKKDAQRPYQQISVLVASKRVPVGTSFSSALDNNLIQSEKRVRKDLPVGYVPVPSGTAPSDLKTQFNLLLAAHDISEGLPIVREDFVAAGQAQTGGVEGELTTDNADRAKKKLQKNLEAITVSFDDTHAVGGFVNPGDHVNVLLTTSVDKKHFITADHVKFTSFLLPNLKVLGVGAETSTPSSQTSGSTPTTTQAQQARGNITFEVTPRQALQLVQAQAAGQMYLTLNPPTFKNGDYTDPGEVVEAINLFDKPLPAVDSAVNQLANP